MPNTRIMLWVALAAILYLNYEAWMHDYPRAGARGAAAQSAAGARRQLPEHLGDSVPQGCEPRDCAHLRPPPRRDSAAAPPPRRRRRAPRLPTPAARAFASAAAARRHRCPRSRHQFEGRRDSTKPISCNIRCTRTRRTFRCGSLNRDPGVAVSAADRSHRRRGRSRAHASGDCGRPPQSPSCCPPERQGTARAVDLDGRPGLDGDQDLRLHARLVRHRSRLRRAQRRRRRRAVSRSYSQILRHWEHASRSYFDVETYSFKGPAVYDGTKSRDLKVENEADSKFSETITNGWLASLQHQFVSAIVPPGESALPVSAAGAGPANIC